MVMTQSVALREEPVAISGAVRSTLRVRAFALGERIELRNISGERLTADSVLLRHDGAMAVIFRHGTVVFFGADEAAQRAVFDRIEPLVAEAYPKRQEEAADLPVGALVDGETELRIPDGRVVTLQIVADVFSKSVALAYYETTIAQAFDKIEPLAADLHARGRADRRSGKVVRHIAQALLTQQRLVGRIEVIEKPELLWEHPDLELLHLKLSEEYELKDRAAALERKLALVARTAEVLMNLLQDKRSLRVEYYIVALILFEILLSLYEMFLRR